MERASGAGRRVVRVGRESLYPMLILGRRHLERVLAEYVVYHDEHRVT